MTDAIARERELIANIEKEAADLHKRILAEVKDVRELFLMSNALFISAGMMAGSAMKSAFGMPAEMGPFEAILVLAKNVADRGGFSDPHMVEAARYRFLRDVVHKLPDGLYVGGEALDAFCDEAMGMKPPEGKKLQ